MRRRGNKHKIHKIKDNTKSSEFLTNVKWGIFWTLMYSALYLIFNFLLNEIFGNVNFFKVKLISILLMGLCFSLSSRIIWSLIHKRKIYLEIDVFFFWTFVYGFSIWFGEFLRDLTLEKITFLTNMFIGAIFVGLIVYFLIKLMKRIEFNFGRIRIKAPSQIFTGIILIVAGLLTFRFSYQIFIGWFNWAEGIAWSWLVGLGLIIAGFLVLLAWWRNNVLQHRVGIKIGKWKN